MNTIEQNLQLAKSDYAAALRTLETISEQIHLQRKLENLGVEAKNESGPGPSSDSLNVPDRPNSEQTSFRSILSDMNRADSVDHLDNISDPNDSDRLSVDSGMWTPGSGGSAPRGVSARLRPRQHTLVSLSEIGSEYMDDILSVGQKSLN